MSKILKNNDFCKHDVFPKFTLGTMSKSLKNCVFFAKTAFFTKFTLGTGHYVHYVKKIEKQ